MKNWKLILGLICIAVLVWLVWVSDPEAQTSSTVLTWTAPGDDGMAGRATTYDLRYRLTPIVGTDTLSWWNGATQVTGEPIPGVAGTTDSMVVLGLLSSSTYRFIIKAADEVPNWSGFSNVAVKVTPDLIPPATVTDLR